MNEINFTRSFSKKKNPDSKIDKHNGYKTKRNILTSRLRKAKKDYYNEYFETNKNNVKETWNLINVSKKATTNIDKIIENGKETTNPVAIADALNHLYVNIGKSVEEKIRKEKRHYMTIYITEIFIISFSTLVHMMKLVNIYPIFAPFLKLRDQIVFVLLL